jgi:hypothetical protein
MLGRLYDREFNQLESNSSRKGSHVTRKAESFCNLQLYYFDGVCRDLDAPANLDRSG